MPLNVGTVTQADISFGPGIVYIGAVGSTPATDLGAISEDGISIEFESEIGEVRVGNPLLTELTYIKSQKVSIKCTGVEWNFDNFLWQLGAGATTAIASEETYVMGGEPCMTEIALKIQHKMCVSGNTMNAYVWRAVGDGNLMIPLGGDHHAFDYSWMALRTETDWTGAGLAYDRQLIKFIREL